MGKGGAREGAGGKFKYFDDQGNPLPTRPMRVPEILTKAEIEKLAREKAAKERAQDK